MRSTTILAMATMLVAAPAFGEDAGSNQGAGSGAPQRRHR